MSIDKQVAEQAPPPAFLKSVINQNKKETVIEPGPDRDKTIANFANSDAWKLLKQFIRAKQTELGAMVRESSDGSASLEEVGFKYLVADQVNTFAQQIVTFVESVPKIMEMQHERRARDNTGRKAKEDKA